ncbi:MAG: FAD-dependent oxidoreductase [Clostridiales bacterium]|nr:FAD-dependent oxidoreductase [Clostridiales bacterium]
MKEYDVIIIGGGPAGLSAAIYASRSGVSVCVVDAGTGGAASNTPTIENYPGAGVIDGYELVARMRADAERCGAKFLQGEAARVKNGKEKRVILRSGEELSCYALVLAFGSMPKKLGVANERDYAGAGLSYCATCDGNFFKGKTVAVVGTNAHAKSDAGYLTGIAKKVYVIGAKEDVDGAERIDGTVVTLCGMPLSGVTVRAADGEERELSLDGLFVSLGYEPSGRDVYGKIVETNEQGYIVCDRKMQTSEEGIFAAGDIVDKPLRQIVCAVSDGAIAGQFAATYARQTIKAQTGR